MGGRECGHMRERRDTGEREQKKVTKLSAREQKVTSRKTNEEAGQISMLWLKNSMSVMSRL